MSHREPSVEPFARVRRLGLVSRALVILGVLVIAVCVAGPIAHTLHGQAGLLAVASAALICLFGSVVALTIAYTFRGMEHGINAALSGVLIRLGVAGVGGLMLHNVPLLAAADVLIYLVLFYLAALVCEVGLTLPATLPLPVKAGGE